MLFAGQCRSLTILNVFDPDMPKAWNGQQRNICRALCAETRVVRMVPVFQLEGFFLRRMPFIVRPEVVSRALSGDTAGGGAGRGAENRRAVLGMVAKFLRQAGDESGANFYKHLAQDDLSGAVRYGIRASSMPPSVTLFGDSFGDRFRLAMLRSAVRAGRAFGGRRGE